MLAVQTAMSIGAPPTSFIIASKQPNDPWTNVDKKLAIAWTILERETCKECGQPIWICRSSNNNLTFSVREDICYAKRELDKWQEKHTKIKPGVRPYVVPEMLNGETQLPSRREYLTELNEE